MKSLLKGGMLVFAATLVWQLSNFIFNVVGAHDLGPKKYGILASAIGLSYLLNPVVMAVQTVASRESTSVMVDEKGSQIRAIVNYYLIRVGLGALAVSALVIVLSPLISRGLHLNSAGLVVIFGLVIPTLIASGIVRGVHQGTRRFERYSLGTLAEGLTKVCCAVAFLSLIWRAPISGMLALLLSALAGLAVNVLLLRHFPRPTSAIRPTRHPVRASVTTFAVFGLLAILLSVDTMTARLTLPAGAAGIYAGISLAGKIVYFTTTAVTAFLFPIFSARFDQGLGTGRWLAISMGLVAAASAAVIAVYAWAPYLVTTVLLGGKYRPVAHDISTMGAIFSIFAMTNLLVMYLLARRQSGIVVALTIAVATQIAGFAMFHRSISDLMVVMAMAFCVAFVGCGSLGFLGLSFADQHANVAVLTTSDNVRMRGIHRAQRGRHRARGASGRHRNTSGDFQLKSSEQLRPIP